MVSSVIAARSARTIVPNAAPKRLLSDIAITRTGKPIIRTEGGRSSLGGSPIFLSQYRGQD
ncbi:NADH-ubiquinone oxidoreductase subunit, mitochondrial [Beauveria bassiana]|nr:NADH-ubiquinone oxidoreductase subunit, mitochondrial [Beauveria bassiana]